MRKRQYLNLVGLYSIKDGVRETADIDPSYVSKHRAPAQRRMSDLSRSSINLIEESFIERRRTLTEPSDSFP